MMTCYWTIQIKQSKKEIISLWKSSQLKAPCEQWNKCTGYKQKGMGI